ncbi:DUF1579 domain-containing protein [Sphingomonas koreensis]|jgi:hypothetical protein|uniref:DUF1579 domain-containing protein n=1 Tax=Sphingomonas koreensis TaxID=93064 RepID=UPI000AD34AF9|nr:DUF1579 domain-containing protein [Sphingomonas koreensis]MDC7808622.1 DUF1579 domain-containing protein [Sphingomonas koreensis]
MHMPTLETRRSALVQALGLAAAGGLLVQGFRADAAGPASKGPESDWAWLAGSWKVRHRRLKSRLTGSTEWQEFDGTCVNWPLMGGAANVDDNVIELPAGDYHGVSVRCFNPETRKWGIWWIDSRYARMEPPVWGEFRDGVGTFMGADTHEGIPVTAMFRWSAITATSAHWEQAFSTDGGKSWESNWHMDFTRVAA